jgi:hypothetical protein
MFFCFYPYDPRTFLVKHWVTILVEGNPVADSCFQEVTVNCDLGSSCTERYFYYEVHGCMVEFNSTFDNGIPGVDITWNFGDGSPLFYGDSPTHSYAQPGVYLVTQDYVAYGISGTCSRWITVGCCCDKISNFDTDLTLECAALRLNAGTLCEQSGRYSSWTLQVGNQTPVPFDGFDIDCHQLTNYSTYTQGPPTLTHRVWCDSVEVVVSKALTPPVEGIFIGREKDCDNPDCQPPTTNISDYITPAGVLPAFSLAGDQSNFNVYVSGIINFNQDYIFRNGINLFMGAAAGFDVPGSPSVTTLEFAQGVSVTGTCCLWRGIYVYRRGVFRSQCNTATAVTNRIQDAMYAVRAFNVGGFQPLIALRQTIFHNNLISLRGTDGAFRLQGSISPPIPTPYFERNQFTSQAPLHCIGCLEQSEDILPSLGLAYSTDRSLAGIWLQGNTGANALTNMTIFPSNPGLNNTFDNLAIGVEARELNLEMKDCATFRNITNTSPFGFGRGINYRDITGNFSLTVQGLVTNGTTQINGDAFDNCTIGVRAEGRALSPATVNIDDCRMVNMQSGIYLDGFLGNIKGIARHNDITSSSLGIGLFDAFANGTRQYRITNNILNTGASGRSIAVYGAGLSNAASVEVDHNLCTDAGALGILANTHKNVYIHDNDITVNGALDGIYALNGQYEIECNNISGSADYGINVWNSAIRNDLSFNTVDGVTEGVYFELDCPGQDFIECNTVQNTSGAGLHYNDAYTGAQYNTGNSWISTAGATFDPGVYLPIQSQFDVPDQTPWKPVPVDPLVGWFFPDITILPPSCQQVCQPGLLPPGGGEGNQFDTGIAGGGLPGEDWDQWRRERYLLYKLAEYPELAPASSAMAAFQGANATNIVGRLTQIGLQTVGLFNVPVSEGAMLSNNKTQLENLSAQVKAIDEMLDESLPATEYESLVAQREALSGEIAALVAQSNTLLAQLQAARSTAADILLSELGVVAAAQIFEQNEKDVLGIYLQSIAKGHEPNATQLGILKAIGAQCPREGGPAAVLMAANLYEGITGETLERDDCSGVEARNQWDQTIISAMDSLKVTVFPNPASGLLVLNIVNGQPPFTIRLIDVLGRVARQQEFFVENPVLDTQIFTNGVYRLQVLDATGAQSIHTFIVKH